MLDPDDEIVIYCTNTTCPASIMAHQVMKGHGFKHLCRYAGGLEIGKRPVMRWKEKWQGIDRDQQRPYNSVPDTFMGHG